MDHTGIAGDRGTGRRGKSDTVDAFTGDVADKTSVTLRVTTSRNGSPASGRMRLDIDDVGINDSFTRLGGHSLLAIRIVAELRRAFQIDLPVKALFDAPTVAELSSYIKELLIADIDALTDEEAERLVSNECPRASLSGKSGLTWTNQHTFPGEASAAGAAPQEALRDARGRQLLKYPDGRTPVRRPCRCPAPDVGDRSDDAGQSGIQRADRISPPRPARCDGSGGQLQCHHQAA